MEKVFCFGAFDGLHDGHRYMLEAARTFGDYLIVAVTQDTVIERLKGKKPRLPVAARIQKLQQMAIADLVIPGDNEISTWKVLQAHQPQTVALGYDQSRLHDALVRASDTFPFPIRIVLLPSLRPEELHSSILFPRS